MLGYIHVQDVNLIKDYASRMLQHGNCNLIPNQHVPMHWSRRQMPRSTRSIFPHLEPTLLIGY